jgi:cell wall-associated NlpC family hydrolase
MRVCSYRTDSMNASSKPPMSPLSSTRKPRFALVLVTVASLFAPVAAGAQETKPFASFSNSAQALRDSVVQMARAQLGKRYKLGGQTPERGFDCSGLVSYVMSALNLNVPRTAKQQAKQGLPLTKDTSSLLPGDLLTFGKAKKGVSHVGIYVGEGRYIHASSVAGKVIESKIDRPFSPLIKAWRGARRLLSFEDSTVVADSLTRPPSKGSN